MLDCWASAKHVFIVGHVASKPLKFLLQKQTTNSTILYWPMATVGRVLHMALNPIPALVGLCL